MTAQAGHAMVSIYLPRDVVERMREKSSAKVQVEEIVYKALGLAYTPPAPNPIRTPEKMALRSTVTRMSPKQRADYRTFVKAGFTAAEAVERVLG